MFARSESFVVFATSIHRRVTDVGNLTHPGYRLFLSITVFALAIGVGGWLYRGPTPRGIDAPPEMPSAGRMRRSLEILLGRPARQHSAGTDEGKAYLQRLESLLDSALRSSRNVDRQHAEIQHAEIQRIEIPFDRRQQDWHPNDRMHLLPDSTTLRNLLVTIRGEEPDLDSILLVTHHDSCPWGPGAGDASSAVVALVEFTRILALHPPRRTTHVLFTDGEEFGLLGAHALFAHQALPIESPAFVLNFDARGTSGGVPMFETHDHNAAWIKAIIDDLAVPKITTSLAVMVYRTLPNATDFDVFGNRFGWRGFNYATIGGAHHYHTPHDVPENLSDRTLQHMGNHVASMHRAIDRLTADQLQTIDQRMSSDPSNAVFFDLFGQKVLTLEATTQRWLATIAFALTWWPILKRDVKSPIGSVFRLALLSFLLLTACLILGLIANVVLNLSPYHQLRYTPVDLHAGLLTIGLTVAMSILLLEKLLSKFLPNRSGADVSDAVWLITSLLALPAAVFIPAGAYLLVLPALASSIGRVLTGRPRVAAWTGWVATVILVGPLLFLLVQAIGPWKQPAYAMIAGLLTIQMAPTWYQRKSDQVEPSIERTTEPDAAESNAMQGNESSPLALG